VNAHAATPPANASAPGVGLQSGTEDHAGALKSGAFLLRAFLAVGRSTD
jgi:hypothetical protein